MVDDETAGGPEAARAEAGAVAIAGQDEQAGTLGSSHDLALHATGALPPDTRAPQPRSRIRQEPLPRIMSQVLHPRARITVRT
ncbi:hypothetical protein [Streptosporangium nondiastaticum]|uniref:hypothetical protein n=1 Tax=Streptosporangium nondiastaticum TaxID=35764 RepID=UPI001673314C|nr:hypothetical protein [Streptosporangium nondiastaticum]